MLSHICLHVHPHLTPLSFSQHQITKKINLAIIALSETKLTAEIEDSEVNVPGYVIIRCDTENRSTGGTVLYVRDGIKYEIVLANKIVSNCWSIAIEVKEKLYKDVIKKTSQR